eukprot:TRINITY_DN9475_c0_g1_i1.p1 TRINITY_DN9475_c0_g1~~TRINITY_DN9475_c0_g1_i1.p1  ORF type:complete len:403 (+),score=65.30 TRINITY_DN9475_c0_g1_i1:97-1305(+)
MIEASVIPASSGSSRSRVDLQQYQTRHGLATAILLIVSITELYISQNTIPSQVSLAEASSAHSGNANWRIAGKYNVEGRKDRYLVYNNRMGRLNNQMQTLIHAIFWSRALRRTLVFPGWYEQDIKDSKMQTFGSTPFETYYDIDYFLSQHKDFMSLEEYNATIAPTLGPDDLKQRLDLPNERFHGDFNSRYLFETLNSETARTLEIGIPYRWTISEYHYLEIIRFFKPRKDIISITERWIRSHLKRPYAGIHLRRWESLCKMPIEHIMSYIDEHPLRENVTSFYLASDSQDKVAEKALRTKYRAISFNATIPRTGIYIGGVIDAYILSFSNIFFANRFSNLSRNAHRYHLAVCGKPGQYARCNDPTNNSAWCRNSHTIGKWCEQYYELVMLMPVNGTHDYAC